MRVLMIVAGLLAIAASTVAAGGHEATLMRCAGIEADPVRLACFDTVVAEMSSPAGHWQVSQKNDPLTEQAIVTIANRGTSIGNRTAVFFLRCTDGEPEAFVSFGEYLGSNADGGGHPVSFRIGDDVIYEDVYWSLSTDKKAVFFVGKMDWLLENLVKADRFVVRTTPYGKSPVTAMFDLAGLQAALDGIGDKCRWERQ